MELQCRLTRSDGRDLSLVHLGETLNLILHLADPKDNQEDEITVELQTTSKRTVLLKQACNGHGVPVVWEVKELGSHIITCLMGKSGKRAYFKFNAVIPFQLKTKVNDRLQGRIFLEAQLCNASVTTFLIDKVELIPADASLKCRKLAGLEDGFDEMSMSDDSATLELGPRHSYQYVFEMEPLIDTSTIGKMEIVWRTKEGDVGRLQTGSINAPISTTKSHPPISLSISADPSPLILHQPATLTIEVVNGTTRNISNIKFGFSLDSIKDPKASLVPAGEPLVSWESLGPGQSISLHLNILPVNTGLVQQSFSFAYTDEWVQHTQNHSQSFYIQFGKH